MRHQRSWAMPSSVAIRGFPNAYAGCTISVSAKGVYHSQSGFAVDFTSRRIRWSRALPEGSNWKREHKFSLAEVLWYNIHHAGLHE
jgi:hypothetical protein